MKIRTITTGIELENISDYNQIKEAAKFNRSAAEIFRNEGYDVQTTRIATNSFEEYIKSLSPEEIIESMQNIDKICEQDNINFFSIGYADKPARIGLIAEIISTTSSISASGKIGDREIGIDRQNIKKSAGVIKSIAENTDNGFGNFRFCAASNCPPSIPFFPAAYHQGTQPAFAIGLECGDLALQAFSKAADFKDAKHRLKVIFEKKLNKIEEIAKNIARENHMSYHGIDASLAPGLKKDQSVAFAYESILGGHFGAQGTLHISSMITEVLKNLTVKTCGYSGLMLPVCEDLGLAAGANRDHYDITNLLLYSAVCGCGLDTVPVAGDITIREIEAILLDTAALSIKLDKPLSVRLFPVPDKKAGEMTDFDSPYLTNCKIFKI